MEKRGKSQEELGTALGVSSKTAHNYLNGNTKLEANQIPIIARFLRIPVSYLFEESDIQNLLIEPDFLYETKKDCELCKSKDKTIAALEENIELLKGQIDFLKKQVEN